MRGHTSAYKIRFLRPKGKTFDSLLPGDKEHTITQTETRTCDYYF